MPASSVRRSITLPQDVHLQLVQLARQQEGNKSENRLIVEALRHYLDHQADIVGSRRHFARSLQQSLDRMEASLSFQNLLVLLLLLSDEPGAPKLLENALLTARRDGARLLAHIQAARTARARPSETPR